MARKEQKAPNYTSRGLELYAQATFALRQAARMAVSTAERFGDGPIPADVQKLLVDGLRRALEMWEPME